MKKLLVCLTAFTVTAAAMGQEVMEMEKARQAVRKIAEQAGVLPNPPFKGEPDLDSPQIISKGEIAACILPMKGLADEQIRAATKDVVPVGMLWLRNLAPAAAGIAPVDEKQIRSKVISDGKKTVRLHPYFIGARTGKGDKLELVFFGKGAEPVISVPMTKMPSRHELPLELAAYGGDGGATLVISLLGKYQAELKIIPNEGNEPEPQPEPKATSKAARAALQLRRFVNDFKNAPLKIDADVEKADMFELKEIGAVIVPHKGLSEKALAALGKGEIAVGQLWMKSIAPSVAGRLAADDELRLVNIEDSSGRSFELPQFLLTARSGKGGLELVVYSADKKPLLAVPLKAAKMEQTLPIELEGEGRGEGKGVLSLHLLGKYQAEFEVMPR